ncbi:HAD-IA family hydrolase [Ponticaulis koreensis]|uniref:HAD-IA family hydrolase n=1 Tax=Ponticaulis koreensis TaxID=1123045 RepID=UPI0003B56DCF|nr:HAD-IA family hydrolase [Ponticaulis koreensis]
MVNSNVKAVIWDFGGVFSSSPFEAFNHYEAEKRLPKDIIRKINSINPDTNAWALLERSELTPDEFDKKFAEEAKALGYTIPGKDVLGLLSGRLRPAVFEALKTCKKHFAVACITNNAPIGKSPSMTSDPEKIKAVAEIFANFDHVIESSKVGLRKPDPKIYELMCEALNVEPAACVYLDDLGINLKPARAMGMTTIKVLNEAQLLSDLSEATGLEF